MKGLEDKKKRCELQLNFVSAIALPLWRGLAKCFPKCSERVARAEEILASYGTLITELDEQRAKKEEVHYWKTKRYQVLDMITTWATHEQSC